MDSYYEYSENSLLDNGEEYDDPHCYGCQQAIEDGSVVQFGDGIWHFECFRCAKCRKLVECYSNLLLLRDGSPICEDCSYSCHACSKTIKDEAIMTGDEAYHAECFCCIQCHRRIENLVFTQTSKGIYCTHCHEARKLQRLKRKEERDQLKTKQNTSKGTDNTLPPSSQERPVTSTDDPPTDTPSSSVIPRLNIPTPNPALRTSFTSSIVNAYTDENGLTESPILDTLNDINELNEMLMGNNTRCSEETLRNSIDQQNGAVGEASGPPASEDEMRELRRELHETKHKLHQVENKFSKIKSISRKALEEFHIVKESYAFEIQTRKEAEKLIVRLKSELVFYQQASVITSANNKFKQMTQQELEMLNEQRADLELLCHELKSERDRLVGEIETFVTDQEQWSREGLQPIWESLQNAYQKQLQSVQKDLQVAKANYAKLIKGREDIISDMILLNTKNAELTQLNNDLSRRVMEKEQEAKAVFAGMSFLTEGETEKEKSSLDNSTARTTFHKRNLSTGSIGIVKSTEPTTTGTSSATANKFKTASAATGRKLQHYSDLPDTDSAKNPSMSNSHAPKVAQRDSFNGAAVAAPRLFKFKRNKSISSKHNSAKDNEPVSSIESTTNHNAARNDTSNDSNSAFQGRGTQKHHFAPFKYLRPVKCEGCNEKMWGVSEWKCSRCSMACHSKCMFSIHQTCFGNSNGSKSSFDGFRLHNDINGNGTAKQPMFGNDLVKQVQAEKTKVPIIVEKCIECVEQRGMDYEGIYRKSGSVGQIRRIQEAFDKGRAIDLTDAQKWNDVSDITSALKQYFRELPNPLFTYELHSKFMNANVMMDNEEKLRTVSQLIQMLPIENFNTLKYLMEHLNRVRNRSSENLMTSKNLAVIFGPTLLRDQDENRDLLEMRHKIGIIEYILNHTDSLFVIETINNGDSNVQSYNSAALISHNRRTFVSSSLDLPRHNMSSQQQQTPAGYL